MTGPREWRHAELCALVGGYEQGCTCGLSALREAVASGDPLAVLDVLGFDAVAVDHRMVRPLPDEGRSDGA